MARGSKFNRSKNRRESGTFVAMPHSVLHSANYAVLSAKAVKLLLDLSGQIIFRKDENSNGNLCAALKPMKLLGWKSADTLDAAEAELLHFGFIEVTQPGNRRNPTLYAVTWLAVSSFEDKPWIKATKAPSGAWKKAVDPMPTRRQSRKKSTPEIWVTAYSRIGLNDHKLTKTDNVIPDDWVKTDDFNRSLYPTIGYLYRSTMGTSGNSVQATTSQPNRTNKSITQNTVNSL